MLHDRGRFGQAALGLTTGGPADPFAASLANQLVGNGDDATILEVSFGGLTIRAQQSLQVAVTGAELPITIDGKEQPQWTTLSIDEGQELSLGFSEKGCRSYLAVRGGFAVDPQFGSTSTVVREGIGGLSGQKLNAGDDLQVIPSEEVKALMVPKASRPSYAQRLTVRVIPGYQQEHFSRLQQRRFFGSEYEVSQRADRMGYRLEGSVIDGDIKGILSEGIAFGAIQIPADGQPIVLLNDRQTIGGYPKIGCALSSDCARLTQLRPGDRVTFTPISPEAAHNAVHLERVYRRSISLQAHSS